MIGSTIIKTIAHFLIPAIIADLYDWGVKQIKEEDTKSINTPDRTKFTQEMINTIHTEYKLWQNNIETPDRRIFHNQQEFTDHINKLLGLHKSKATIFRIIHKGQLNESSE